MPDVPSTLAKVTTKKTLANGTQLLRKTADNKEMTRQQFCFAVATWYELDTVEAKQARGTGSFHTQKEPAAAPYVKIAFLRNKCNLSKRSVPARVRNRQISEAISSARVGREEP